MISFEIYYSLLEKSYQLAYFLFFPIMVSFYTLPNFEAIISPDGTVPVAMIALTG